VLSSNMATLRSVDYCAALYLEKPFEMFISVALRYTVTLICTC
jgi:hypothetical protein